MSAGLLPYRRAGGPTPRTADPTPSGGLTPAGGPPSDGDPAPAGGLTGIEVYLGHMGGPFWARRPRAWSLIKGELQPGEDPLAAAEREWSEEVGSPPPAGRRIPLGQVRQSGGKTVQAWAVATEADIVVSGGATVTIEWPPRSGRTITIPEIDQGAWHDLDAARDLVVAAQSALLDRLEEILRPASGAGEAADGVVADGSKQT